MLKPEGFSIHIRQIHHAHVTTVKYALLSVHTHILLRDHKTSQCFETSGEIAAHYKDGPTQY